MFTQADSSMSRKYGGTGLGLAISKRLIDLMGGGIGMHSALGSGSTFWVTLPVAAATPARCGASTPATIEPSTGQLRILVVEDNSLNALVVTRILNKLGCVVEVAENGRVACEHFERARYNLILMDCQMPEVDGFEATCMMRARETELAYRTPIVALSANVSARDAQRCREAGMDGHLPKPTSTQQLTDALQKWCARPAQEVSIADSQASLIESVALA
jgi:CheY-like chemotaxis protein